MKFSTSTFCMFATIALGVLASPPASADDIDIFVDSATGGAAPNVMFLIDNTSNYARQANQWGFNVLDGTKQSQGQAEVDALVQAAQQIRSTNQSVNIGIAELTDSSTPYGGYVRFGARDISNDANFRAFYNILGYNAAPTGAPAAPPGTSLYATTRNSDQKIADAHKDEGEALYELYKYYNSLSAYAGVAANISGNYADYSGAANVPQTTFGQGLRSGFGLNPDGRTYTGNALVTSCSKQYIVYIANNASGASYLKNILQYESTNAGLPSPLATTNAETSTDEWVRFLNNNNITTYILDANNAGTGPYNAQYSTSLQAAAAQAGPNNYYNVKSSTDIVAAISKILLDIQSVNSAFAATSLPASATNRSVDQNEVFLGLFRPDGLAAPRWYGNLKRFQLILNNGSPDLGDALGVSAINSTTGFLNDCAQSFWTSDTSAYQPASTVTAQPYWSMVPGDKPIPKSACPTAPTGVTSWSPFSDLPDGPSVEKGGAAEILRRGNVDTSVTSTWQVNRTTKTLSGTSLVDFNASATGVSLTSLGTPVTDVVTTLAKLVGYVQGWDANDENVNTYTDPPSATKETRPSIHGDVIHSTPLPITYNATATGVMIYYGSNDGIYHAVEAASGKEKWSFIAPEFFSRMYRLYTNSPQILYPSLVGRGIIPAPTPKDYGFDGSTGSYQSADNSQIWIYPSMRRGGRMIYAFDVSPSSGNPPATPTFLWKAGCPNLANDTGCTTSMTGMGQTWSTPVAARIKNGPADMVAAPVVVVGGGYDSTPTNADSRSYTSCEDQNTRSPSCSGRKGNLVYIFDAHGTGGNPTLLKTFPLPSSNGRNPGSVAGDVALLDANNDGFVDYAYLSDTNGFVYRIDFVDGPTTLNPVTSSNWSIHQIAGTTGSGRKFQFAPTLFFNQNKVYVGLGTGDREHPLISQYPYTSPVANRFYLFVDDPASTSTFLDLDGSTMENATTATCTEPNVLPSTTGTLSGWFKNLTGGDGKSLVGEQVVTPAVIVSGQVSWGTNRPLPPIAGACTNQLGEARGYLVDLVNGSGSIGVTGICGGASSTTYVGGGLPPPPSVGIVSVIDPISGLPTYIGTCIGCPPKGGGPGSTIQPSNPFTANLETRRRVYWFTPNDK